MITREITATEAKLITLLAENCELEIPADSIEPGWTLFDIEGVNLPSLHLDSLAALELIVCVSNEFGVELDEAPKEVWFTIQTLARHIDDASR